MHTAESEGPQDFHEPLALSALYSLRGVTPFILAREPIVPYLHRCLLNYKLIADHQLQINRRSL